MIESLAPTVLDEEPEPIKADQAKSYLPLILQGSLSADSPNQTEPGDRFRSIYLPVIEKRFPMFKSRVLLVLMLLPGLPGPADQIFGGQGLAANGAGVAKGA